MRNLAKFLLNENIYYPDVRHRTIEYNESGFNQQKCFKFFFHQIIRIKPVSTNGIVEQ